MSINDSVIFIGLCIGLTACTGVQNPNGNTTPTNSNPPNLTFTSVTSTNPSLPGSPPKAAVSELVTAVIFNNSVNDSVSTTYTYTFNGLTKSGPLPAIPANSNATISFSVQSPTAGENDVILTLDPANTNGEPSTSWPSESATLPLIWTAGG